LPRAAVALRVLLASLVVTLTTTTSAPSETRLWACAGVAALALGATLHLKGVFVRSAVIVEYAVCTGAVLATGGADGLLVPLLIAPALPAGVILGITGATSLGITGAAALLITHGVAVPSPHWQAYASVVAQWAVVGLLLSFVGSWSERLVKETTSRPAYATAHRLLSELRIVARRLPTGLDSRVIAARLLEDLHEVLPFAEGTVLVHGRAGQLSPVMHRQFRAAIPAQPAVTADPASGSLPQRRSIDLPLAAGDRAIGLVTLVEGQHGFDTAGVLAATALLATAALPLDAALIFDEVREVATVEERHRLARNIHDGIAQELASVSYALDNALFESERDHMATQVATIRTELRRVLSELRLSIYELRSDTPQTASLATALSTYVHSIGRDWGLTIHVNATESTGRLSADCEAELLRIAQEALTNARKHAAADNIWVTLTVQAPSACLVIEDDGMGFSNAHSPKSFGLQIMRERASRIGASFSVSPRPGRGTLVEVVLGSRAIANNLSPVDIATA
jgi:signal transduction histidine kinase